ncbi:unnamed protein product [Closterium sp. NIES-53]
MYLMTCTRPDLAYPLSILARYVAPGRHRPEHMAAAKRVLRYLCSTSGMGLVLGGRRPVVLTGHADASWADDQATQRSSQGYTFSLGSGSVSWRSTRSSSVLSSSCEAVIYAGAMAAQELRWLTYLLTDLGEQPRSPPVLYVDNKAMLALCREHRLEHRTKHIALRYFLARELQQRGQLRLAYVASEANTADIFTKALAPACFALLDWSCDLLFSPTLPMGVFLLVPNSLLVQSFLFLHTPAQSNNSNNNATSMSLDGSSYARGNQQQRPTFAPYEPQRGSVSFMPHPQPASGQEKTLDALQVQSQFAHVLKLQTTRPFDGKDFFTWSFEFELMMEGAQILGFFDGSLPYLTHGTQYDKQQYTYQSMMAYTILLINITPSQQQNIRSYRGYGNSAELAYNHLKNLYQATDIVNQSRLMAQLTTVEMKPGEKGMAYISRCRELRDKLLRCGGSISEDAFVTVIIGGLGPQWRSTRAILRPHGKISEAALCAEIHAEQQDMDLQEERHKKKASVPEFAFHSQRRYNNNNRYQPKPVPPFCHLSKTSGHPRSHCPNRQQLVPTQRQLRPSSSQVTSTQGIHLEADSITQEFKLYHGKGGLYTGKAVLKNNVFVLDFVPDLGTADSDGIVTFTSWTHPPDLDPDFSPEGFWYSHTIPEADRTSALATIQHSAAAETSATPTTLITPVASSSTTLPHIDNTSPTPA